MKIGIDARLIEESGVGRYIRNLIIYLGKIDHKNSYVLFLPPKAFNHVSLPNSRWSRRAVTIHWHSIWEQLVLPGIYRREHLDLLHVPYFTIPIFYSGAMVVTVHDLTILHIHTGKATQLPRLVYELKRLGYWIVLRVGLSRAKRIFAVSETTKREIMEHFGIRPENIVVTPEGIDAVFLQTSLPESSRPLPARYFLYVGNAYPHKNLDYLLDAFSQFLQENRAFTDVKLLLVGRIDPFYRRFNDEVQKRGLSQRVEFVGEVDDGDLVGLYRGAQALVFPSLMEGFGLPALEAIACGTPVVVSDIPVFHEMLGSNALYVNPGQSGDLVVKLKEVLDHRDRYTKGLSRATAILGKRYSWQNAAEATLATYNSVFTPTP